MKNTLLFDPISNIVGKFKTDFSYFIRMGLYGLTLFWSRVHRLMQISIYLVVCIHNSIPNGMDFPFFSKFYFRFYYTNQVFIHNKSRCCDYTGLR